MKPYKVERPLTKIVLPTFPEGTRTALILTEDADQDLFNNPRFELWALFLKDTGDVEDAIMDRVDRKDIIEIRSIYE